MPDHMIYADYAATAPLLPQALEAMLPWLAGRFGNPSSVYAAGREARRAVDAARERVADLLGAQPQEIYFTSGGTESDNWAIRSALRLKSAGGGHIISAPTEHHAVLHTLRDLEKQGCRVTWLPVDSLGRVSPDDLRAALEEDTALVTLMTANNEVGTLHPIPELSGIAHEKGVLFHTDAVQAGGHIPLAVDTLGVDLLSLSAHKFGGPKGVGALYMRRPLRLPPLLSGGAQERGLRAGTENVAGIVGLAAALAHTVTHMEENTRRLSALRDGLIHKLTALEGVSLTGDPENRLPGLASFLVDGADGEALVLLLDQEGVCASAGSACSAGAVEPSHVLLAMGYGQARAHGSLRLSLGEGTTPEEAELLAEKLTAIIPRVRTLSALK